MKIFHKTKRIAIFSFLVLFSLGATADIHAQDAAALVDASYDYMRGKTSVSTVVMTIHRPDWERVMTIKGWTQGMEDSIFWITDPPRDKGNGTLKKGREMWTYNPKVNRIIKIPPSMMSQAWMGSDFSNNDLSKAESLIVDYTHTIIGTETHEGKKVYVIKSMPKPEAPVVWGMQKLKIREDYIFLEQGFYDEDLKPVKIMTTLQLRMLGGRLFPGVWKMQKADVENEYTVLEYQDLAFDTKLPDRLFTLSSLKTPIR
ncbi:MAG TPA: outer membrane lipoprotein-sorting protein [Syntrophales bacterium]|nr:outer membrane lipoprotein-sorting protein [Syntrophales bacterium]HPQ43405.1 outer membrane lipoprotein-sorting protein [Syntrophales bacterium]